LLSDVLKTQKSPKKRPVDAVGKWYSDAQKLDAVKLWLVSGNLAATAAAIGIPYETVKTWRYSKWWSDLATEIKSEGRVQLSQKLKAVASKALEITMDRLENGDIRMSPTGELARVPVPALTAAKITNDFLDRHNDLEKVPEEANTATIQDRLASLAATFEDLSKKIRRVEVLDIIPNEVTDAVYDQREEGLQEGAELGEDQEAFESQGPGEEGTGS
jgi:transposase-like protein